MKMGSDISGEQAAVPCDTSSAAQSALADLLDAIDALNDVWWRKGTDLNKDAVALECLKVFRARGDYMMAVAASIKAKRQTRTATTACRPRR